MSAGTAAREPTSRCACSCNHDNVSTQRIIEFAAMLLQPSQELERGPDEDKRVVKALLNILPQQDAPAIARAPTEPTHAS